MYFNVQQTSKSSEEKTSQEGVKRIAEGLF